jgi:Peptidase family M1 domain
MIRLAGAVCAFVGSAAVATGAEPPGTPAALAARLEEAWNARDASAYAELWQLESRSGERAFAQRHFGADEAVLSVEPPGTPTATGRIELRADLFVVEEPRGRAEQWLLSAEEEGGAWRIVERSVVGSLDGLLHLSLDPNGYDARGRTLSLEDFELEMQQGTLFTSPVELGPTVLVFVGKGRVRFRPPTETEQTQLAAFCGRPALDEKVERAFVRVHPADLGDVLSGEWVRDGDSRSRLRDAVRFFDEQVASSFVLDAQAPRSPWWLTPALGDAVVTFDGKRGPLTYSLRRSEPEAINLFHPVRRIQINRYPVGGAVADYDEDAGRAADLIHRDLQVRFEPGSRRVAGTARLRVNVLKPVHALELSLDQAFSVSSVTTAEAGRHLFFRVRGQNKLMVSMGRLAGRVGEIELTVRYAGSLDPGNVEHEVIQIFTASGERVEIPIERVLVYTNYQAWHPRLGDDFATSRLRFDVPEEYRAVSGGRLVSERVEGGRRLVEIVQDQPGRYVTAVVGRLEEVGAGRAAGAELRALSVSRMRQRAESDLQLAQKILDFFAEEFGPAPYSDLSLVFTEGEIPGGHSPPGMVVLSYRPPLVRGRLVDDPALIPDVPEFFLAHEIAHQWWGHGVAPQNYRERWVSEAFAQYAAALWVRHALGEEAFERILRQFDRWARRLSDRGPIHLGYRLGHIRGDSQVFRAVVYDKGAYVLHMLRGVVGDGTFRDALMRLQTDHRFQKIGTRTVREALERASGLELGSYFDAWVFGTEIPRLYVRRKTQRVESGRELEVEVRALGLPGPVPLEIRIRLPRGERREQVTLAPGGGRFRFTLEGQPEDVEVNADRGLLAEVRD